MLARYVGILVAYVDTTLSKTELQKEAKKELEPPKKRTISSHQKKGLCSKCMIEILHDEEVTIIPPNFLAFEYCSSCHDKLSIYIRSSHAVGSIS